MSRHSFDPEIAKLVGVNAAVIYQNLVYWIEKNEANQKNFRDGKYWTYNSYPAFKKLFPYFSEKQIRTALDKLIDNALIVKGNYNQDRFTHTNWYALVKPICPQGQNEETSTADGIDQIVSPSDQEGGSYKEEQTKTKYKPNRMREAFLPLKGPNFARERWEAILESAKLPKLAELLGVEKLNGVDGFFVPEEFPPFDKSERSAMLKELAQAYQKREASNA